MKRNIFYLLPVIACMSATSAHANWQNAGRYTRGGTYNDDSGHFSIAIRGGGAIVNGKMKNKIGDLAAAYYVGPGGDYVMSAGYLGYAGEDPANFEFAGFGNVGELPAADKLSDFSFTAGASLGWTIPNSPQWRLEIGWDHVSESDYDASPMFTGQLALTGGALSSAMVSSGSVHSTLTTDIFSVMAFYDFFDGARKPVRTMIPYVGIGVGYADAKTVLQLTDLYGDLSEDIDLREHYAEPETSPLDFYRSETNTANVAGLLAAGVSYGLSDNLFLDFGARLIYVPEVKWKLSSADGDRTRDWFSAENLFYTTFTLGLRYEF